MDQKTVRKLELELEKAIVDVVVRRLGTGMDYPS